MGRIDRRPKTGPRGPRDVAGISFYDTGGRWRCKQLDGRIFGELPRRHSRLDASFAVLGTRPERILANLLTADALSAVAARW